MMYIEYIKKVLLLLIVSGGVYVIFSIFCVAKFFRLKREEGESASLTPVSVLKPVKGGDPDFRTNIESFCRQDYPEYEVLLGFTDPADSAISTAEEVASAEPDRKVRVVIGEKNIGVNQKVSNLQGLIEEARYPLLVISDSDMKVERQYLKRIVTEYSSRENVGLVTSLYKISDPSSAGAALESLTVALDFIPSVLVAARLEGITFGLGASIVVSKDAIDAFGGLAVIADYLADDYQIGNRLWKKGYKLILSDYVIEDVVGDMSLGEYLVHQVRWSRTYRASRPKGFFGYGLTHTVAFAVAILILQPSHHSVVRLGVVLLLRLSLGLVVCQRVIRSRKWLKWLVLLPIKDLISFGIWGWSFMGRNVYWRGRYYRIVRGGRIEPA